MKAIRIEKFGGPEVLKIQDIEITDVEKISTIEKAVNDKNYSEEELFEFYKKFQSI